MGWRYNGELGRRVPFSLGIYILVGEKDFKGNLTNEYVITKWPECCEGAEFYGHIKEQIRLSRSVLRMDGGSEGRGRRIRRLLGDGGSLDQGSSSGRRSSMYPADSRYILKEEVI